MEEIKEILKMVSEGIISVEEAERLIKAVGEGRSRTSRDGEKSGSDTCGRRGGRTRRGPGGIAGNIGAAVFEGLSGLGGFIADTISQATSGLTGEWEDEDRGNGRLEELFLTGGALDAPWAKRLMVSVMGGDTTVKPVAPASEASENRSASGKIVFSDPEGHQGRIRAYRSGETLVIKYSEGDLEVEVPGTIEVVKVKMAGGAVRMNGLACRCSARTMGGDVELTGCTGKTDAKTFGGRISIHPAQGFDRIRASTNGGDVELRLPADGSARIRATTLAGRITADSSVRAGARRGGLVNTTAEFEAGASGGPMVELSTVAGSIRISGSESGSGSGSGSGS